MAWWTGWSKGVTQRALAAIDTVEWCGGTVLASDAEPTDRPEAQVVLLPALDPTPMGWKQRSWFLPEDHGGLYDRNGNIGPSIWWNGEVIGAWASRPDGFVATSLLVDRGEDVRGAVEAAAEETAARLAGKVVVPAFRTPMERRLSEEHG